MTASTRQAQGWGSDDARFPRAVKRPRPGCPRNRPSSTITSHRLGVTTNVSPGKTLEDWISWRPPTIEMTGHGPDPVGSSLHVMGRAAAADIRQSRLVCTNSNQEAHRRIARTLTLGLTIPPSVLARADEVIE